MFMSYKNISGAYFKQSFSLSEVHATGFNYQNEDEKVTLSFPSTLQKGKSYCHASCSLQPRV